MNEQQNKKLYFLGYLQRMSFTSFLTRHNKLYNYLVYPKSSYRYYDKTKILFSQNEIHIKITLPNSLKSFHFKIKSKKLDITKHKITKIIHKLLSEKIKYKGSLIIYGLIKEKDIYKVLMKKV